MSFGILKCCVKLQLTSVIDDFLLGMVQHAPEGMSLSSVPGISDETNDSQDHKKEKQRAQDNDGDVHCYPQAAHLRR